MKIALVHDWLLKLGGAERVLIELHRMYPTAPIYTLFYDRPFVRHFLPNAEIRSSNLQRIPLITKNYPLATLLMPSAIESFDFSDFDTVISSSVTFSKGLVLRPGTRHICYCYSPSRMLWDRNAEYERRGILSGLTRHFLRIWDRSSADRVDQFIAISKTVQDRIKKYYGRDSIVIYPPTHKWAEGSGQKAVLEPTKLQATSYYLLVSRLHPHKNIDIAIEAFNKLGYNLAIVGDGPLRKRLEKISNRNIFFTGPVNDATLAACYQSCKALIMPQEEDFGLTPLEAMSFGKPVLALRKGGALETIQEGITGEFFDDPIPEALADGVKRLNQNYNSYNPDLIRQQSSQFSLDRFKEEIKKVIQ